MAIQHPNDLLHRHAALCALHQSLGAKLVPFAGYEMPVQYRPGILAEHLHNPQSGGDCSTSRIWVSSALRVRRRASALEGCVALLPATSRRS